MINIADRLHAATEDGIVTGAAEIYDDTQNATQASLNASFSQQLSGAAQQGDNPLATNTAILAAIPSIPTDYAKQSNVGTSSDQASESGSSLFAVLKAVWNKVVNIYNALTDGTNGLSAIKSAIPSVSGLATETSVKDGNDTAIGLLKDQTNGLTAIASLIGYTIQEIDGV